MPNKTGKKMKKFNLHTLIFALLLLTVHFSTVRAQEQMSPNDVPEQNSKPARRPNLLAELNLSAGQIEQIRRINREKQPLIRAAQQRVRDANRSLDTAIYADDADETEVQNRLKEVQTAQAEVHKIRSLTEFAVRKTLNQEQLVKFRELRQKFKEQIENSPKQRQNRLFGAPRRKLLERQRKLRSNN